MSNRPLDHDDPRLAAYVLGEVDDAERAAIAEQLAGNPDLQAVVDGLSETARVLTDGLAAEAAVGLTERQRESILQAADDGAETAQPTPADKPAGPPRGAASRAGSRLAVIATSVLAVAALIMVLVGRPFDGTGLFDDGNGKLTMTKPAEGLMDNQNPLKNERALLSALGTDPEQEEAGIVILSDGQPEDENDKERWHAQGPGPGHGRRLATTPSPNAATSSRPQPAAEKLDLRQGGFAESRSAAVAPLRADDALDRSVVPADREKGGVKYTHRNGQPDPSRDPAVRSGSRTSRGGGKANSRLRTSQSSKAQTEITVAGNRAARTGEGKDDKGGVTQLFNLPSTRGLSGQSPRRELASRGEVVVPRATSPGVPDGDGLDDSGKRKLGDRKFGDERYNSIVENKFVSPSQRPLSTFGIDVDTASYANVRRFLNHGQWPPADAVRIEELVNYFKYNLPVPDDGRPFSVTIETGACPWQAGNRLVRVSLQGREIARDKRPPSNLVFLIDVSGSMRDANKLPLVKNGLELLVRQMTEDDRIAIVTYASNAGLVLDSTSGQDRAAILSAVNNLNAGGSTNGEAGIRLAYRTAIEHFIKNGTNRIILCTDGDFNVGVSNDNELVQMVKKHARSQVYLSILGFGMGNLKDGRLEQIADKGNGHYGYIDSIDEAKKVFGEELTGTLYTIAQDVKVQVEFNPGRVGAWRLIGYENRSLADRDFTDDTKDAGEIGAGHSVTALYEIVPADRAVITKDGSRPLKYANRRAAAKGDRQLRKADDAAGDAAGDVVSRELLTVWLRHQPPGGGKSIEQEHAVIDDRSGRTSADFDWAASVAAFGMILRRSPHRGDADLPLVRELARGAVGKDPAGRRAEFLQLVKKAGTIQVPVGRDR